MSKRSIVSDTGPLISLEKLFDGYAFIRKLYDVVIIPASVLEEVSAGQFARGSDYLAHYRIADLIEVRAVPMMPDWAEIERLDEGEKQAIVLALELKLPLLIEEAVGRTVAKGLGLAVSGIAGQILRAFRLGVIKLIEAEVMMDTLLSSGRINRRLHEVLRAALRSG